MTVWQFIVFFWDKIVQISAFVLQIIWRRTTAYIIKLHFWFFLSSAADPTNPQHPVTCCQHTFFQLPGAADPKENTATKAPVPELRKLTIVVIICVFSPWRSSGERTRQRLLRRGRLQLTASARESFATWKNVKPCRHPSRPRIRAGEFRSSALLLQLEYSWTTERCRDRMGWIGHRSCESVMWCKFRARSPHISRGSWTESRLNWAKKKIKHSLENNQSAATLESVGQRTRGISLVRKNRPTNRGPWTCRYQLLRTSGGVTRVKSDGSTTIMSFVWTGNLLALIRVVSIKTEEDHCAVWFLCLKLWIAGHGTKKLSVCVFFVVRWRLGLLR